MWDFLSFDTFISPKVLVFVYYIMAVVIPLFLWSMRGYILKKVKFLGDMDKSVKNFFSNLSMRNKIAIIMIFLMMFFCMELCLRMMFEMMIGYFDMHEYLQKIAS
jgi:uncharacterized membrane protein SpoIIM required for sporulation